MVLSTCIQSNTVNSDKVFALDDTLKVKHSHGDLNLYTV